MSPMEKVKKNKNKFLSILIIMTIVATSFSIFNVIKIETVKAGASTSDFSYHINLTVENTYVTGTHTDFPVLVLNTSCDILDGLDNNDFTFFDTSGEEMDWELVNWDDSSDTLEAWVRFNLTGGTDTFELHYEDTADTGESDGGQHNPTDVWDSNFVCVYHIDDVDGGLDDSTTNNLDAAEGPNGVDAADYGQTGKVGDAVRGDGTGTAQDFQLSNALMSNAEWQTSTLNCWFYAETVDELWNYLGAFHNDVRINWRVGTTGSLRTAQLATYDDPSWSIVWGTGTITEDAWNFVCARLDTSTQYITVNSQTNSSSMDTPDNGAQENTLMATNTETYGMDGGFMDEFWLSDVSRSDNWVQTVYDMTNNGTVFLNWGGGLPADSTCELILRGNPSGNYTFTLQGEVSETVWANDTGAYYETGEFIFTIAGTDYFERLTINVSDVNDTEIDGNDVYISLSSQNSSYTNWHQCSNGGEQIIVNGTNWDAYGWMNNANPFTADGDSDGEKEIQSTSSIWLRVRIAIPADADLETHANYGMTWDAGAYN